MDLERLIEERNRLIDEIEGMESKVGDIYVARTEKGIMIMVGGEEVELELDLNGVRRDYPEVEDGELLRELAELRAIKRYLEKMK